MRIERIMNKKGVLLLFYLCMVSMIQAEMLKVSQDNCLFEREDGSPFLWIGDTAWELFHVLDREEAVYYLDNRKEKGFTVIQGVVLSELRGINEPNAYGDLPLIDKNPLTPNEKYFEHVDFIVREAQKRDLFIGMLPTWGDKVTAANGGEEVIFTPENAYTFGKFLGNRYKDNQIIWILGGDRNVETDVEYAIWNAMAKGIEEGDGGKNLITYHPRGEATSAYWFHNTEWLDFNAYQSGHARRYDKVYEYSEKHRLLFPRKPFVNAEPAYEDIGVRFWDFGDFSKTGKKRSDYLHSDGLIKDKSFYEAGIFDAHDVRVSAYWSFLSGAAGYTYGNNAIWQMFKPNGRCAIPALSYWNEALDRPGAQSMFYLSEFFKKYPLNSFFPDQSVIYGINPFNEEYIVAVTAKDKSFIIAYLSKGQNVKINTSKLSGKPSYKWYNPATGKYTENTPLSDSGICTFEAPTHGEENDWLLVIEADKH